MYAKNTCLRNFFDKNSCAFPIDTSQKTSVVVPSIVILILNNNTALTSESNFWLVLNLAESSNVGNLISLIRERVPRHHLCYHIEKYES